MPEANDLPLPMPFTSYIADEEREAELLMQAMPTSSLIGNENEASPEVNLIPKHKPAWCLCEMPEGEFPRVTIYPTLAALVSAIAAREGKDTAVWVTYGTAFNLTKAVLKPNGGKVRYLLLAEDDKAVRIDQEQPPLIIESSLLPSNIMLQEEGWLGDSNTIQSYYQDSITQTKDEKPVS